MGLVGVFSFRFLSNKIEVIDFILSCRAFGRSIEKSMLFIVLPFPGFWKYFVYFSIPHPPKKNHMNFFWRAETFFLT